MRHWTAYHLACEELLEDLKPSDIMTRDSLHKMLRPQIEASAIRVF